MKKLLFCLFVSPFFPVYCWFLFLMLFKLFYLCGEFEWVSDLLREGKEKWLSYFFLEVSVMGCSCLRRCFVLMSTHWFYLTAGWNHMGWNILFKPGPVRAGCSGICPVSIASQVHLVHSWAHTWYRISCVCSRLACSSPDHPCCPSWSAMMFFQSLGTTSLSVP